MIALIISANPLFMEVIREALAARDGPDALEVDPGTAIDQIHLLRPEIILVDERLPQPSLEGILSAARTLPAARVLLLSASANEMVVMDSFHATLHSAEDLMETIMTKTSEPITTKFSEDLFAMQAASAREEAGMYGFLAALVNQSPDASLVKRLRDIGVATLLEDCVDLEPTARQGLREIDDYVAQTLGDPEDEMATALAVDWTRLFRGIRPGYGPPPPYEALYRQDITNPLELLQVIMAWYGHYDLAAAPDQLNRPDYLGLELGFLSHLAEIEARSWEQGDQAAAQELRRQSDRFYVEHLSRWVPAFCQAALPHCQTGFYRGLIHLTQGILCLPLMN